MPPRKISDIFTTTKHLYCNQLWRIQSPIALRREFHKHFKLLPHELPHSYVFSRVINRFMASGNIYSSKLPGPS